MSGYDLLSKDFSLNGHIINTFRHVLVKLPCCGILRDGFHIGTSAGLCGARLKMQNASRGHFDQITSLPLLPYTAGYKIVATSRCRADNIESVHPALLLASDTRWHLWWIIRKSRRRLFTTRYLCSCIHTSGPLPLYGLSS